MYKKPSNKQREFMSRVTQVRNEGFFKIHKSVLIGLASDWVVPQLKKIKRGQVKDDVLLSVLSSTLDTNLVLKAYYQKGKQGWFKDHWHLVNIKLQYKDVVLLKAKSPTSPYPDVEVQGNIIPNELINNFNHATVSIILDKWEKDNA